MKFATKAKQNLYNLIHDISDNRKNYVKNPQTDFVRNRKFSLEKPLIFFLLCQGSLHRTNFWIFIIMQNTPRLYQL